MHSTFTDNADLVRRAFHTDAASPETLRINRDLAATLAGLVMPDDITAIRSAYAAGALGLPASPRSSKAIMRTIAGPAGEIALRVFVPEDVRGVYVHIHGGGWMLGSNDMLDAQMELIARDAKVAIVAPNYRLAPEAPFPAPVDDNVAVMHWVIDGAAREFGTGWLAIGGESAGANLAMLTMLRLRDEGAISAVRAANLFYGCFDLSLTPSMRRAEDSLLINAASVRTFADAFRDDVPASDPRVSPLFADLADLPPALFSVGTSDPLSDDTLFMHARYQSADNSSELALYPGGVHGFNTFDGHLALEANRHAANFLSKIRSAG